jgi:hypothetical protein
MKLREGYLLKSMFLVDKNRFLSYGPYLMDGEKKPYLASFFARVEVRPGESI